MEGIDVNNSLLKEDLFLLFKNQLQKDFESAGINAAVNDLPADFGALKQFIVHVLAPLLANNSTLVSSLLYRVDVSEQQLQKYQLNNKTLGFDEVLAELIIKRVLQKVILRKTFSK